MTTNYELVVETHGHPAATLADIIAAVSWTIGGFPNTEYQSTKVTKYEDSAEIAIRYRTTQEAEAGAGAVVIPPIIYAILLALTVLGIVWVTWRLFVVTPTAGYVILAVAGIIGAAYLIKQLRR